MIKFEYRISIKTERSDEFIGREKYEWLKENIDMEDWYYLHGPDILENIFYFKYEEDAMAFKLRWG